MKSVLPVIIIFRDLAVSGTKQGFFWAVYEFKGNLFGSDKIFRCNLLVRYRPAIMA